MSKNLHVIIPAAGDSSRFYKAGYRTHKPFLTINYKGKTGCMLDHVLTSLNISPNIPIYIGIPPGYTYPCSRVIHKTQSHVDTASQLLRFIPDDDAVIFADCDVLISSLDFVNVCLALSIGCSTMLVSDRIKILDRLTHIDAQHALWSLRGYPHAGKLKQWMKETPSTNMDTYLKGSSFVRAINTPVDWGTPEALLATGARIVS